LRAFEFRILEEFKTFSPAMGGGKAKPRKGLWIRGHLLDVDSDYVYGMWMGWCRFVDEAENYGAKIPKGTYGGFKTYIWLLKKLDLILKVGEEDGYKRGFFKRTYYTLNPAKVDSQFWENPFRAYEEGVKFED